MARTPLLDRRLHGARDAAASATRGVAPQAAI